MAWFILARAVFVAAVGYSAYQAHPFAEGGLVPNVLFGVVLAVLFVLLEMRLRTAPVTHVLGALLGGAIGLGAAKVLGDALYWANLGDDRVVFGSDWPHIEGMPRPLDYTPELAPFDDAARAKILRDNAVGLNALHPA